MASVHLWRVAAETRAYKANDLSGSGAAQYPGRWNAANEFVVYCAETLALAVLETAAHLDDLNLPLNRFVVQISVPQTVWKARRRVNTSQLNPAWRAIPPGRASIECGSSWYTSLESALLEVPSVLVEEERVVLVNAKHPDAKEIRARTVRPFDFNRLFRGSQ